VVADIVNPVGKAGDMDRVTVPEPPDAVTGVKEVAALFAVSTLLAMAWVAVTTSATPKVNVLVVAVAPTLSVTTTL
jgi:hypothetical protein